MKSLLNKKQNGFTLIELMSVIGVIGIVAAIAIPSYQFYTKRSHVIEGLTLAGGARSAVAEFFSINASWPADNIAADLPNAALLSGNAVTSVAIDYSTIVITYNNKVTNGSTIIMKARADNGTINWDCTGGTVSAKYRPTNCL